jgi:hypothetical protein
MRPRSTLSTLTRVGDDARVMILYFAHSTLQHGFARWERHRALLGEPVGRFRTVDAWSIAVVRDPACLNASCRHLHRMCGLVADQAAHHAEGDLFAWPIPRR